MQRRAAGLVMVLIAVIGVLIINATGGRSVPGFAHPLPRPAIPASGTCVLDTAAGWVTVGCADPHTAEVVQSSVVSSSSQTGLYDRCVSAGRAYLGDSWGQSGDSPTKSGWLLPPVMSNTVLVSGPGRTAVKGWSWQACVVRPTLLGAQSPGYRGRLRDVPATGVLPAALRPCFNRPGNLGEVGVSCSFPHTGEVLAARQLQIFGADTARDSTATSPQVRAECRGIASRSTAVADPTYGGQLEVVVDLHATGMGFVVSKDPGDASQSYVLYRASCALQAARGRELSASVVGLGAGPPPLT